MNQNARDALINAGLSGEPQSNGSFILEDEDGNVIGRCGLGILGFDDDIESKEWDALMVKWGLQIGPVACPECSSLYPDEATLVTHLNDMHEMDFITIARKMP